MSTAQVRWKCICVFAACVGTAGAATAADEAQLVERGKLAYETVAFLYSPPIAPAMSECVANLRRGYDEERTSALKNIESLPKKSLQDEGKKQWAYIDTLMPAAIRSQCAALGAMYLEYMNNNTTLTTAEEVKAVVGDMTESAYRQLSALLRAPQKVAITNGPWNRGAEFERFLVNNPVEQGLAQVFSYGQRSMAKHKALGSEITSFGFSLCYIEAESGIAPATIETVRQLACRSAKTAGCDVNMPVTIHRDDGSEVRVPRCE